MTLQIETIAASMFIALLIVVIVMDIKRRARMTAAQRAKEDAEPFDDAW